MASHLRPQNRSWSVRAGGSGGWELRMKLLGNPNLAPAPPVSVSVSPNHRVAVGPHDLSGLCPTQSPLGLLDLL